MKFWALADLHLNFGVPEKSMEVFGSNWTGYTKKIALHWDSLVEDKDVVLIPGDISWALKAKDAAKDLAWLHERPGKKVLLKGNHDHWWTSKAKVEQMLPSSVTLVQNSCYTIDGVTIAGARLWDSHEYTFDEYILFRENRRAKPQVIDKEHDEKLFIKELQRLTLSLESVPKQRKALIVMTHYPPVAADLRPSRTTKLLEEFGANYCVFGHLHNVRENSLPFGCKNGIQYILVAADYCNFSPQLIFSTET